MIRHTNLVLYRGRGILDLFLDALGGNPVDHSVLSDGVRDFCSVSEFIYVWKVSRL